MLVKNLKIDGKDIAMVGDLLSTIAQNRCRVASIIEVITRFEANALSGSALTQAFTSVAPDLFDPASGQEKRLAFDEVSAVLKHRCHKLYKKETESIEQLKRHSIEVASMGPPNFT